MGILDKIKQFFRNIGNKQKLLDSPKEIKDYTTTTSNNIKEKSEFLKNIKFDTKDLLDPRVCRGDDIVPNILKSLGVKDIIADNPRVIEEIGEHILGILHQNGLHMPNQYEEPTRNQINSIVECIKSNGVLSRDERMSKYNEIGENSQFRSYNGLNIDKETGNITLQRLTMQGEKEGSSFYSEQTFSTSGTKVIKESSASKIDMHDIERKENLENANKRTYNEDGIIMEDEIFGYKQIDGKDVLDYHNIIQRDTDYPFIEKNDVIVSNGYQKIGTSYRVIDMSDLSQLERIEEEKGETGESLGFKEFESKEEVEEYYQEHKEKIDNALVAEPKKSKYNNKVKQSLQNGIKKLAINCGILEKEQNKEEEMEIDS